jgi:hypothetical protein
VNASRLICATQREAIQKRCGTSQKVKGSEHWLPKQKGGGRSRP